VLKHRNLRVDLPVDRRPPTRDAFAPRGNGPTQSRIPSSSRISSNTDFGGGATAGVNDDELDATGTVLLSSLNSHLFLASVNPAGFAIGQSFDIIHGNL
jgi:hypothetical protein